MVRQQKSKQSKSISIPSPAAQRAPNRRPYSSNNSFRKNYQNSQPVHRPQQRYYQQQKSQPNNYQQQEQSYQYYQRQFKQSQERQHQQEEELRRGRERELQAKERRDNEIKEATYRGLAKANHEKELALYAERERQAKAKRDQELKERAAQETKAKQEQKLKDSIEQELRAKISKEVENQLQTEQARLEEEFRMRMEEQLLKHDQELKKREGDFKNLKYKLQRLEKQKQDREEQVVNTNRAQAVTMRAAKLNHEKIEVTIVNDKTPAMNGHNQNHFKSNGQGKYNDGKPPLRAILGNSAMQRQPNTSSVFDTPESNSKRALHPRVLHPGQVRSTGISVNHRLKVKPQLDALTLTAAPATPPASPENGQTKTTVKATPEEDVLRVHGGGQASQSKGSSTPKAKVPIKLDASIDAVSSLKNYCHANNLEQPAYNTFNDPPHLHCSVRIAGDVYSSYPQEFSDKESAYQRTAQIAIQRIQRAEANQKLSVCTLSDEEFIDGLHKELLKYPHGILDHKLEAWYGSTFRQHLPSHWYDLIMESSKIRIEHGVQPRIILFANDPGSPEQKRISTTSLPQLALPWQLNENGSHDWNMFISHCDSTKLVWVRMIDQIANFDELTKHMSRQMEAPLWRQKVAKPYAHEIYLVETPDGWNRVRVISIDEEQRSCRCHFVDFGDVALFDFEDLFNCPPKFLVLPAQAVCLSMYALDKFEDHPHAQAVLAKELDGQSVVAHVLTTEKQFLELGGAAQGVLENGKCRACLVATLYDTSTAEDIHLNDLVASRITKCTPAPSLSDEKKIGKTTPILVSHINDDGDLMVLLRNDDLKFVERSIAQTVADLGEQDRVSYSDLIHDSHVFVCDESVEGLKQWFRGRLVTRPKNPEEETFDVYYVDDGRQRKTHISNIYRLEANNRALATFPPQAIPVRLHDVPEIDGQMLARLRGLMPSRCEALLKVVAKDGAKPLVNVIIRPDPESTYICVNLGLRVEFEMARSVRPEKSDYMLPSSNVQLPRRGSFSSVVSSQSSSSSDLVALTPPVTPQKAAGAAAFSSIKDYEAIPAVGAYFEVRVSLSVNPGHFSVQPYKCYNQLQTLMKDLQEHCKGPAAKGVQPSQLAIGEAYAAPDNDGVYHRVSIRKIYDEIIHVRFVDVGDDGVVACDQLKTLQPDLRKLSKLALPAQLYGIQLTDVVWSKDNCVRFRELTLGQKFIGIVRRMHKQKDDSRALCLELVDTSTPNDIKLHEILLKEKHAQPETKEV